MIFTFRWKLFLVTRRFFQLLSRRASKSFLIFGFLRHNSVYRNPLTEILWQKFFHRNPFAEILWQKFLDINQFTEILWQKSVYRNPSTEILLQKSFDRKSFTEILLQKSFYRNPFTEILWQKSFDRNHCKLEFLKRTNLQIFSSRNSLQSWHTLKKEVLINHMPKNKRAEFIHFLEHSLP